MFTFDEIIEARLHSLFYGDVTVFPTDNPQEIQDLLSLYNNYDIVSKFRVGERTYTATLIITEDN